MKTTNTTTINAEILAIPRKGGEYVMTFAHKAIPADRFQKSTAVVGNVAYRAMQVKATSAARGHDDTGDYLYVGYEPINEDKGACRFGYAKLYLDPATRPSYGLVGVVPL